MKKLNEFMREKRETLGLSLRDASRKTGVSHTHIRDVENANTTPSFDMVMKFLNAYNVDVGEFLKETGHLSSHIETECMGATKLIPVISWTQAGNWQEMHDPGRQGEYDEYVQSDSKGVFALRVRGDSMETEFNDGDMIIINPNLKAEHNDYVVVANASGEATFKQLKKYGRIRVLHPLNPRHEDIELDKGSEYRIIGVIIEKKKRYRL